MKIQDLNNLIYNPIWISTLLHYFISGAENTKNKKIKFELVYLVVPFLFNEMLILRLMSRNARSNFSTLFENNELKNCLIGINKRVSDFTEVTNKALVLLGTKVKIVEGGYIQTLKNVHYQESTGDCQDYYKAAYNLGIILAKEHYREVFLKIGALA